MNERKNMQKNETVTKDEDYLMHFLLEKDLKKDEGLIICLYARKNNITDKILLWLKDNPNSTYKEIMDYSLTLTNYKRVC